MKCYLLSIFNDLFSIQSYPDKEIFLYIFQELHKILQPFLFEFGGPLLQLHQSLPIKWEKKLSLPEMKWSIYGEDVCEFAKRNKWVMWDFILTDYRQYILSKLILKAPTYIWGQNEERHLVYLQVSSNEI